MDLSIKKGDIFGFIGPNGAGKSTTIRLLLGLISPNSGSMSVLSKNPKTGLKEILPNIGYMSALAMFYPNMKVSEVISFAAKLHRKDCSVQAKRLCERFMLDTNKRIRELSFGNRRKVGIICAFQHEPELYILDEPTSSLDPLMQSEFFDLIKEENLKGATVFLSSHILSEIQRYCKNAGIIKEGRLIALNSVSELSKSAAKRVNIIGISKMPSLSNTLDIQEEDNSVSFLYTGNVGELLSALDGLNISDMTILEPDLNEIFMHFYKKEDA